jgi:ABC-type ATPase with predicted acetyltransferase domain
VIIEVRNEVPAFQSYAAERTRGLYNVDAEDGRKFHLKADLPVDRIDWQIGAVVGPSGSGKTSIVRELVRTGWEQWTSFSETSTEVPLIEQMTWMGDYNKATAALSAVGLGSVPSWLRPFAVLSNGEQFRASMAMLLLATQDEPGNFVIDEFTSVLDRQVAQVAAGAFAKAWRRKPRRVIVVTPHYDILEWLQPDWWIDTAAGLDQFAEDREVLQARKGTFPAAADRAGYSGDRVGSVVC